MQGWGPPRRLSFPERLELGHRVGDGERFEDAAPVRRCGSGMQATFRWAKIRSWAVRRPGAGGSRRRDTWRVTRAAVKRWLPSVGAMACSRRGH